MRFAALAFLALVASVAVASGCGGDTQGVEIRLKPTPTSTPEPAPAAPSEPETIPPNELAQQPPPQPTQPPAPPQPTEPAPSSSPPGQTNTPEATPVDIDSFCAAAAEAAGDELYQVVYIATDREPIAQQFGKDITTNYYDLCVIGSGYVDPEILCIAAAEDTVEVIPQGILGGGSSGPTIYDTLVDICLAYYS